MWRNPGNKFGKVVRTLWPGNTEEKLAAIADVDVRTARRWIAGEFEAPSIIIAAIIVEITKRE